MTDNEPLLEDLLGSDELPLDLADRLNRSLFHFARCIGTAVTDICSWGVTIGESYVPFDPDPEDECEDQDAQCSQVWVRVSNITPMNIGQDTAFGTFGCCEVDLQIDVEVGIIRCIEMKERGEAPTASDVLVASMQNIEDMQKMFCAAMDCKDEQDRDIFDRIDVGGWNPMGPLGGQYGGIWTFTVEL